MEVLLAVLQRVGRMEVMTPAAQANFSVCFLSSASRIMSSEVVAEFARLTEEQIPVFLRQSADLRPDVSAKIHARAAQEAESWAQAFGSMFTMDEGTPKEAIAILAGIRSDRASELDRELVARFEEF